MTAARRSISATSKTNNMQKKSLFVCCGVTVDHCEVSLSSDSFKRFQCVRGSHCPEAAFKTQMKTVFSEVEKVWIQSRERGRRLP